MSAIANHFGSWIVTALIVFFPLYVKGDIAPDIITSYPEDNLIYDDPMEYQRAKRSDVQDDDDKASDDDDELADEGFDDEDEDDEENDQNSRTGVRSSYSSGLRKKDEIDQKNAMSEEQRQQQQHESIDDDDDDESGLDEAGWSSGSSEDSERSAGESGSAEGRNQSFYASREPVSGGGGDDDASANRDEIEGSSDMNRGQTKLIESEEKKPAVSVHRSKPRNLIKMVLEESRHAEQLEKLETGNHEETSAQDSGSSAALVQQSDDQKVYHEEKGNQTELPQNGTSLHKNIPRNSSNETSVTVEGKAKNMVNESASKLLRNTTFPNEKAKDEGRSKPLAKQVDLVRKQEGVRKKSVKKASVGVSHVKHLARKRVHGKHMTSHVVHPQVAKKLSKVVHKKTVNKGSSQMCHTDKIFSGHSLKGSTRAGHFDTLGETPSMHACLQRCCSKHTCDVALLIDGHCFGVACYSKELCEPVPIPHPHFVFSQLGLVSKGQKRGEIEKNRVFHCEYGNLTLKNNEQWSGELCGGVVTCKDGIATVKKCPGIPPKPNDCTKPRLVVRHRKGECCTMKWKCKARHCTFNNRVIKHGYKLSDPLCTGVLSCYNGQLHMEYCPKIPQKPKDCARPKLKTISVPGKCCKKLWVCSDKSCKYDGLKLSHGEKLTDASCAVVMECRNGFLHDKQCPGPPPVPRGCINPSLKVKRIPGECCEMNWTCDIR